MIGRLQLRSAGMAAWMVLVVAAPGWGDEALPVHVGLELACPESVPAKRFLSEFEVADGLLLAGGSNVTATMARCSCQAVNQGKARRGVVVNLEGTAVDAFGTEMPLGSARGRTRGNGYFAAEFDLSAVLGTQSLFFGEVDLLNRKRISSLDCHCTIGTPPPPCQASDTTACLRGGRFQVDAEFKDPFDGTVRPLFVDSSGRDSATFQFFPLTTELLVKVLDHCGDPAFSNFWVFAAATTNVEFEVTILDTLTGDARTYDNPGNHQFEPITDTGAFWTCP